MNDEKPKPISRTALILEAWTKLESDSLGAREIEAIQNTIASNLGENAVESPASIARTLAETGVPLRHPEVFDYDTLWRERHLADVFADVELNFSTIEAAIGSLAAITSAWDRRPDEKEASRIRTSVVNLRAQLRLSASSKTMPAGAKMVAAEVEQWLGIWLQNPHIFQDWLELRLSSPDFRAVFSK